MASTTMPRKGASRAWGWLDERLGIGGLRYPVPAHANSLAYTLGGITLVSFRGTAAMRVKARSLAVLSLLILLVVPGSAMAHGGEESPAASGTQGEGAEVKALAMQPARTLAQQALATLRVNGDSHEAGIRLDAALESKDKSGIDVAALRKGTETLDSGDASGAIPLLDEALSRPLGANSGKALHEAGREFQPATGAQEIVGIVVGGTLLALGVGRLLVRRRRTAGDPRTVPGA